MRVKKAWIIARKDFSEFRANRQILLTLAIFPIVMTAIPIVFVVSLATLSFEGPAAEPVIPLNLTTSAVDQTFSETPINNMSVSRSVIVKSYVNGSYINNSTLEDVVVHSSLLDNVTVRNSVLVGCVLRNSNYDVGTTLLIDTFTSGTTKSPSERLRDVFDFFTHGFLMFVFFAMAVGMPTTLAAFSFVGEKGNKTLEPLLATPLTDSELLWGKYLAVFVPVMALIFLCFAIFVVAVDILTAPLLGYMLLPDVLWAFGIFVITPLICLVGISVNVLISSKVSDVRTAQQYSALIIMPLMLVFFLGPLVTSLAISLQYLALAALGLLGAVALLTWLSLKVFNREGILTTWK